MSTYNPHAYVIVYRYRSPVSRSYKRRVAQSLFIFPLFPFSVVYSVVDAESLRQVEEILHFLWRHSLTSTSASHRGRTGGESSPTAAAVVTTPPQLPPPPPVVILVANKIDLVRSRIISPQGAYIIISSPVSPCPIH